MTSSNKLAYYSTDPSQLNLLELPLVAPSQPNDPQQPVELRDYQKQVRSEVYQFFRLGKKSCLVYAPTGAGKTVISAQIIADAVGKGRRVLFCCHRQKLIRQTQQTLLKSFGIESGIIWADHATDYDKPVQICMIQTIQNRELPEDIGLVIFDECHSSIYYKICWNIMLKYSGGIFALSPCYFIGLTATPWRTKLKEGFCQYFDCIVRAPDPIELVRLGYLARPRLFGYGGLIDFSQLETSSSSGDYTEASLQKVCNEEYNAEVVAKFLEICPQKKTLAFCAGVKQAENLAYQFNSLGIKSAVVVGDTPEFERELIFHQFAKGEIQLISSVGCLCEGFDEPSVEAAIIARPTRSKSLLIQMCGRALRLNPGKNDAFLLDFGECFKRCVDPRKKLPIGLCPSEKPIEFSQLKECLSCHAMIPIFSRICPECGHEFIGDKWDEPEEDDMPQFGELLTEEEEKQLKYIRQQMKTAYTRGRNPARVTKLFHDKFGYFAPDEWFVGAIFGMKNPRSNQQIYRNYLQLIRPEAPQSWFDYMLKLEFGIPKKKYQTQGGRTYTAPPLDNKFRYWYEILGVAELASWDEIKSAYRDLAKRYHPDRCGDEAAAEIMKLINHAFDVAKEARR